MNKETRLNTIDKTKLKIVIYKKFVIMLSFPKVSIPSGPVKSTFTIGVISHRIIMLIIIHNTIKIAEPVINVFLNKVLPGSLWKK